MAPLFFVTCLSLGIILYVFFLMRWRGYLVQSGGEISLRNKAMRQLALYFLRIVVVFVFSWISANTFAAVYGKTGARWPLFTCYCFIGIQPTVTFCFILTKPDVRKYRWQLVTLYNIFGNCSCKGENILLSTREKIIPNSLMSQQPLTGQGVQWMQLGAHWKLVTQNLTLPTKALPLQRELPKMI